MPATAWRARRLVLPAVAMAVVATVPLATQSRSTSAPTARWTPLTPAAATFVAQPGPTTDVRLLGYNDFHGALQPPAGSCTPSTAALRAFGRSCVFATGIPAGGVAYLAKVVKDLRAEAEDAGRPVLTVGAGDLIGASPLISAAFHDEPAIEAMNSVGLDISSVGNHEFDEGTDELTRMQNGGCNPAETPGERTCRFGPFAGAAFDYLSANVVDKSDGQPLLKAYEVRKLGGVKVGFVGVTLKGTPQIVNPAGIRTVDFLDEAETANKWADYLRKEQGVKAMVLLIHQGGTQNGAIADQQPSSCNQYAGDVSPIVAKLDPSYGVVVSGHTHRVYSCVLPNSDGDSVVTSAGSNAQVVTDIDATLRKGTGEWAAVKARNVVVRNAVQRADGSWADDPTARDPQTQALVDRYRAAVAPIANRVVGSITADINRTASPSGEFPAGNLIADGMLAYTRSAGAQIAFMNSGGVRSDFVYNNSPGGEAPGQITYGEAFTVQPFNNLVTTATFTGAQLKSLLEQQFAGCGGQTSTRILQPSAGFTYSYDSRLPCDNRVSNLALDGTPVDPAGTYRVTSNDFVANGGDGFTRFAQADRTTAPGFDIDALVAYFGSSSPLAPPATNRITKLG